MPPPAHSPLLRCSLCWGIWGQVNPRMARLLPDGEGRRRETRVGKVADGNADESRKACVFPENSGPACWTEMKGHYVAALGRPFPRRGFSGNRHLLISEPRLVADHGAGASLTC